MSESGPSGASRSQNFGSEFIFAFEFAFAFQFAFVSELSFYLKFAVIKIELATKLEFT